MTSENRFQIGDIVTTDFFVDEHHVPRRVVAVAEADCSSGLQVSADGGERCPHCGLIGSRTPTLDSSWFKKVKP